MMHYLLIETFLKELEVKATKFYNIKTFNYKVQFNVRSSRTLGFFSFKDKILLLRFNPQAIKENGEEKYLSVVRHEFAHLVIYMLYGNKVRPHGKEWRAVMRRLGDSKPRATTGDFTINGKLTHTLKCSCSTHLVSARIFDSVKNKKVKYICKKCNTRLF